MCDALRELMKPELEAAEKEAYKEGVNKAREEIAKDLLKEGSYSDEKIATISKLSVDRVKELKSEIVAFA